MTIEQAFAQIARNLGRIADVLESRAAEGGVSHPPQSEPQTDLTPPDEPKTKPQVETKAEAKLEAAPATKADAQKALVNLTEALQDNCAAGRAILAELGAKKMSDVAESDYAVIIEKCKQKLAEVAQ